MRLEKKHDINSLQSVRSFRQDINHKMLVLRFPPLHVYIRASDPLDIVLDIPLCPFSSCNEIERKDLGSRTTLMSASGRLVTHIRKFGCCESTSLSKRIRTFWRGDDKAEVFGHSSKPSTIRKMGACRGSFTMSFKQQTSASSLGCREPLS